MSGDRIRFLDAAERIGRRLCRDALWSDGRCTWLGWAMEPRSGQWVTAFRAMAANLYDGTSGIGLFLARLARLTDDPIIRNTATAALGQALTAADALFAAGECGFYSGLSGIAWASREAGWLLDHEGLMERGEAALRLAGRIPPNRHRLDIINGSAGLIPVLLDAAARGCGEALGVAVQHGEHLMNVAARSEQGWSWDTLGVPDQRNLLGYAHGASGIACALAELAQEAGREDFAEAALEALRYERHYFVAEQGNWPDLRNFVAPGPNGEPVCMTAWCHGAPGIGMARLRLHQLLPDSPAILAEAETAIRTTAATLAHSPAGMGNCSLCHGDFGNADLLISAADVLDRPELRREAETAGFRSLEQFEDKGAPWPCGVMGAGETPNLLLGVAGIGHFLLRLYDSRSIATVMMPAVKPAGAR